MEETMTDKYIINTEQQGQPQNSKSSVGSPNVVDTIGGHLTDDERIDEGPVPPPDHPDLPGIRPRVPGGTADLSGRPMREKLDKKLPE
jgi:hypothetical protein